MISGRAITCENGHWLYTVEVRIPEAQTRMVPAHPKAELPRVVDRTAGKCPECGAPWLRTFPDFQIHYEDGWK